MQSLMFLDCFVQKLSKKNLWGGGRLDPLAKEGLRLDKGRVLTPTMDLPIFVTMKMTFNLNKFWYGVR